MKILNWLKAKIEHLINKLKGTIAVIITLSGCLTIGIVYLTVVYIPEQYGHPIAYSYEQKIIETAHAETKELTLKEQVWNLLTVEGGLDFDTAINAMAIIQCESGWNKLAINKNTNGTYDIGLVQWNSGSHKEVSRECAFDVYCSVRNMVRVYKQDHNFNQWVCAK